MSERELASNLSAESRAAIFAEFVRLRDAAGIRNDRAVSHFQAALDFAEAKAIVDDETSDPDAQLAASIKFLAASQQFSGNEEAAQTCAMLLEAIKNVFPHAGE